MPRGRSGPVTDEDIKRMLERTLWTLALMFVVFLGAMFALAVVKVGVLGAIGMFAGIALFVVGLYAITGKAIR